MLYQLSYARKVLSKQHLGSIRSSRSSCHNPANYCLFSHLSCHVAGTAKANIQYPPCMATGVRPATRRRVPKLSEKPEPWTGRRYASFRGPKGTARRQRFTRNHKESEQPYRCWVIENYDDSADIVIRDGAGFKSDLERTPLFIATAYVHHDERRVRSEGSPG